ncbi:DUF1080 domain-containing protein [Mucilaginibacter gynuensis]|uniref:DUF1080 domain-containing protein n=1 Tax=Mucilaginibacter gynuensis TaxID=1302236 RepID=A0ABP8GJN1_9SPHI
MKKLLLGILAFSASGTVLAQAPNTLTAKEKKDGWVLLFDGTTTTGWHTYNQTTVGESWKVTDGALTLTPGAEGRGDLTTDGEYENYELSLEWKIAEGGNSGIIFDVHEDAKFGASYLTGIEMQVLDDVKAEDNKQPNHLAGSLYDIIAPARAANAAGQWNTVKIRQKDGKLTFWMNGSKVVNVGLWDDNWKKLVAGSKFKSFPDFATYKKGRVALQDHGATVSYRNIKVKQL